MGLEKSRKWFIICIHFGIKGIKHCQQNQRYIDLGIMDKCIPVHAWQIAPEIPCSVSWADFNSINQHRVTL